MSAEIRLFVAAYPPQDAVAELWRQAASLALPPHRRVPEAQVHLTLLFLGNRRETQLGEILTSVQSAAAGGRPISLAFDRVGAFPAPGPARMVAATAQPETALTELHRRLVSRLATRPNERQGSRFIPHLTLARFSRPQPEFRGTLSIDPVPMGLSAIVLARSVLARQGAVHTTVATVPLGAGPTRT